MALLADQISLTIAGTPLVGGVSLAVEAGSVTVVLGPNGAGKSSLLRLMVGDIAPTQGHASLNGETIREIPAARRARSLAVLPQQSLLNFPFTSTEVVMLGRTPHATGAARDAEIVREALAAVDGSYLAGRIYTELSGGEKQRVHLARVLAQVWEPLPEGERFLVLDEPTSSFDLAHQQLTLDIVRRLAGEGMGVLLVLHDLNLAARCADQLVLMQCGHVAAMGAPRDVLTEANIRDVFQVDAAVSEHPEDGSPLVII